MADLCNNPNSVLQEKLVEFGRTSAYKFLSNLISDNVKAPTPGSDVKLTKKELELFEEYVSWKISPQYRTFQALQILVDEYNFNLSKATREEAGIKASYEDENETITAVTNKDKEYDYAKIADKIDHRGRKYRIIQEIDEAEYNALKYRAKLPGVY